MKKATITIGIPASGKTTWAEKYCRENNAVNINRDNLRFSLFGLDSWATYKFTDERERLVTEAQFDLALAATRRGKDIVVSDTNLSKKVRESWVKFFKDNGYVVEEKVFHVELLEAYRRDALRTNGVGQQVIYGMYMKYLEYTGRRTYTPSGHLPKAVIVDVDGTVADMEGIRKPFEWEKVGNDRPRYPIMDMVAGLQASGHKVVFLSGRDAVCRTETAKWLSKEFGKYDDLFMREENDQRKDNIVKEEIFWRDVATKYDVVAAIDDRPQVLRLWFELGIQNVVSVGNPYIEF